MHSKEQYPDHILSYVSLCFLYLEYKIILKIIVTFSISDGISYTILF